MTDEQLDQLIGDAYEDVEMSPEAEDRILANLLAAEAERDKGTATLSRPVRRARRRMWLVPAAAAAVIAAIAFMGNLPGFGSSSGSSSDAGIVATSYYAEESDSLDAGTADSAATESTLDDARHLQVIVLGDGRSFVIDGIYDGEPVDADALMWGEAEQEDTGEPCEVAILDDGTALVRFEDDDTLYLAG